MELNPITGSNEVGTASDKIFRPNRTLSDQSGRKAPPSRALPHTKLVGVPTIEGLEFVNIDHVVRCEGLQKCTLIVTTEKSDVISSYSIGKFAELLRKDGFFPCHRSHLINLKFVKKYTREGYIFFSVSSKPVPLARRRRCEFLALMRHL